MARLGSQAKAGFYPTPDKVCELLKSKIFLILKKVPGCLIHAAAVILAHTHPSGNTQPSEQDIKLTHDLKNILKVVDVRILDHLIIGDDVTSLSDLGLLQEKKA